MIFSFILSAAALGIGIYFLYRLNNIKKLDNTIIEENKKLEKKKSSLLKSIDILSVEKQMLEENIKDKKEMINDKEGLLNESFDNYIQVLDIQYKEKESEHDNLVIELKKIYDNLQDELIQEYKNKDAELGKDYEKTLKEIECVKQQLKKLQDTREAISLAQLREEEIKNQLAFYSLPIDNTDLADIEILESIKPKLAKPRILSMLIWSTFFQKSMTALCNNVIGPKIKTGIYKITNQKNSMCYIGQAVDIATRWKEHAKFGLNIDTPANNKLYQAMIKDGIWNFTWEVLEECDKTLLNEKERSYIEIYQSNIYGYNSTVGNKK